MLKLTIFILLLVTPSVSSSAHLYLERYYQEQWCKKAHGIIEYVLPDKTRVDCLTDEYAIEVDFANKWAEAIGQALYYGIMTNRKPGIVLILEKKNEKRYLKRLKKVANKIPIKIWSTDPLKLQGGHWPP